MKKCSGCPSRAPQPLANFINKIGKECKTCIHCRELEKKYYQTKPERQGRQKRCEHCNKQAVFNFSGQKNGLFCSEHKEAGMVNVMSQKCKFDTCQTQPCYNFPNLLYGEYCVEHKLEGMVNVRERPCEFPECLKKPNYNFPTESKGRFCKTHKEQGMVNVLSNHCQNCTLRASYNFPDQKKGLYCNFHKKEGMINIISKRCEFEGCNTIPVYNLSHLRTGRFCFEHKENEMIDVLNKRCKTPMCDIVITNGKNRDYCSRCFAYMFPNQQSHYKTRENSVGMFLRNVFPDITLTQDKRVECHLYRPDFVIDMGSHTIVIEIDENQHKSYDTSCNNKRLMSIFEGLGSRPMIMLRFNPDGYNNIPSCWNRNHEIQDQKQWNKRLEYLQKRIQFWMTHEPERELTFEHLYFSLGTMLPQPQPKSIQLCDPLCP